MHSAKPQRSKGHILLVEDDPGIRSGLESILLLAHYTCETLPGQSRSAWTPFGVKTT